MHLTGRSEAHIGQAHLIDITQHTATHCNTEQHTATSGGTHEVIFFEGELTGMLGAHIGQASLIDIAAHLPMVAPGTVD